MRLLAKCMSVHVSCKGEHAMHLCVCVQVCGGNAGQLLNAASAYTGDWEEGAPIIALSAQL